MRRWRGLGLVLLAGAVAALSWGATKGDLQVALVFLVPVIYGTGPWGVLGVLLFMGAVGAFAADAISEVPRRPPSDRGSGFPPGGDEAGRPGSAEPGHETGSGEDDGGWLRGGGVIMLGPIPIVLGSDRRTAMIAMGLAVLLMALGLAWIVLGPG